MALPRFLTMFLVLLFVAQTAVSQEIDGWAQQPRHEFVDKDGNVVAEGTLVEIDGSRVVVSDNVQGEIKLLIADLSEETQDWIREEGQAQKARESARKKFQKLMEDNLNSPTEAKVIQGLIGLRKLGKDAPFAAQQAQKFLGPNWSEKVRYQGFLALIATQALSEQTYDAIVDQILSDRFDVMDRVAKAPKDFMLALATFDSLAIPYLQYSAFTGYLMPETTDPSSPDEPASNLNSDQKKVRLGAIAGLATLPAEDTLEMVIEVLHAAHHPAEGEPDESTVKACITAIGDMGIDNDMVSETLAELEGAFGTQVERARSKIAKANKKDN